MKNVSFLGVYSFLVLDFRHFPQISTIICIKHYFGEYLGCISRVHIYYRKHSVISNFMDIEGLSGNVLRLYDMNIICIYHIYNINKMLALRCQ